MTERIVLKADEGMVLTNGVFYGRTVYLAEGSDPGAYRQITEAEYRAAKERKAAEDDAGEGDVEVGE